MAVRARLEAGLQRLWWQPAATPVTRALAPLSTLYARLFDLSQRRTPEHVPRPVVVVGNVVAGGGGKTPTVIALVRALRAAGWQPGVVSGGYGAHGRLSRPVTPASAVAEVGDEPLLIARRTGVPVWVGADRVDAARRLCAAEPTVDVVVSDDGLQHRRLARDVEIVVFDDRGIGNGRLLPAGPLREPLPSRWPGARLVLYTAGAPSTRVPGFAARRRLGAASALADWREGRHEAAVPLGALQGRPLLAAAGIAAPGGFFAMLAGAGLQVTPGPMPDHHPYRTTPWPPATPEVVVTEKDAVKLAALPPGGTLVWVVPLDLDLPAAFVAEVLQRLRRLTLS